MYNKWILGFDDFKELPTGLRFDKMKQSMGNSDKFNFFTYCCKPDKDGNVLFAYNECLWLSKNLKEINVEDLTVLEKFYRNNLVLYIKHVEDIINSHSLKDEHRIINSMYKKIIDSGDTSAILVKVSEFYPSWENKDDA